MNTTITAEGWHIIEQDTHVGKWIIDQKKLDHDDFLIPIACANMQLGWVVMDCGALYGDHSLAYARTVSSDGCVIAIEANPMAFECLKENAKKFQSPTICMNLVLSDDHGGKATHIMDDANIGASTVDEKTGASYVNEILENEIRTASIDGIVHDANLDRLNFIKIDCEGWEFKILKGAKNTIKDFKPVLLIEMNSFALSRQDASYKDIYDFLLEMNYSWRIVQPDLKGGDTQYDILAWPNLVERPGLLKAEML